MFHRGREWSITVWEGTALGKEGQLREHHSHCHLIPCGYYLELSYHLTGSGLHDGILPCVDSPPSGFPLEQNPDKGVK
jgi:hypothetical protein